MKSILSAVLMLFCLAGPSFAADYLIGKGDILSIRVWGESALDADVLVRPDGKISMPGIGDVQAAGQTPAQLQRRIAGHLSQLVYQPMVTVMLHSSSNKAVIVHGGGVKPGVMPLEGGTTLLQLLSIIGPDYSADLENAYLERGSSVVARNFQALYKTGDKKSDLELLPGDRLFIPLRATRLVHVTGAVVKPSSLPFYEGMTLLEAIHQAGGYTKFASPNNTEIVRQDGKATRKIQVRAGDLIDDGDIGQNVLLQGGDYILVKKGWF